jgi:hypothetical protein
VSPTDEFVRLVEQRTGRPGRPNGKHVRLLCPGHDDHDPSLDVTEGANGQPLAVCRSQGCTWEAICAAIGWQTGDDNGDEWTPHGPAIAVYPYVDENGKPLYDVCRTASKQFPQRRPDPASRSGWRWNLTGVRRVLYRLRAVLDAVATGKTIYIPEGEKDVHTLERLGLVATCNPGGAGKWDDAYAAALAGARLVVVLGDDDDQGRKHANQVARSLAGRVEEVKVVQLWPAGDTRRDVTDWAAQQDDASVELDLIVEDAPAYEPDDAPEAHDADQPFALPLDEFIAAESDLPPALVGADDEIILPAVGLLLLVGRGGRGKTTLTVDAILHMASGIDWLGFHVGRALRILMIENEGPRELFRQKLERKRDHWTHPIAGAIFVHTESWGAFTLSDPQAIERLRAFIDNNQIDLVIADPLDTLGVAGVGSPDEVRQFVALMVEAGLNRTVAFWLLHHPHKERTDDELDEAAGAWGGKPDTMLRIDVQTGDRARLSFPKVRWSRRSRRPALILAFDPATESYTVAAEESEEERDYLAEVEALLADGIWRTSREIAAPKDAENPGIGANADTVKAVLEENPDRFESRTGEDAVALGRRSTATVWQLLIRPSESVESVGAFAEGTDATDLLPQPSIEAVGQESVRSRESVVSDSAESVESVCVQTGCLSPRVSGAFYCPAHSGVTPSEAEIERLAELARQAQEDA